MRYVLEITTDSDAFQPEPGPELARILRDVADKVEAPGGPTPHLHIRDINGNSIGQAGPVPHPADLGSDRPCPVCGDPISGHRAEEREACQDRYHEHER